jgi:hypothetical protein
LEKYYYNLPKLFEGRKKVLKQIKEHIIEFNEFDNYYIVDKKWYNKLLKIYESDDVFKNDNIYIR